jgi:hypothetical protein
LNAAIATGQDVFFPNTVVPGPTVGSTIVFAQLLHEVSSLLNECETKRFRKRLNEYEKIIHYSGMMAFTRAMLEKKRSQLCRLIGEDINPTYNTNEVDVFPL